MKIGYTEFSFGYAFTENLIRSASSAAKGAPIFPNLVQEASVGYDVHIDLPGLPLFFQYKLPELMKLTSASEISKHKIPGLAVPFFRMPLMRRDISNQHKHLIDLEKSYPWTVFYVTPMIESISEFNNAYNFAVVHQRSVFFSPTDVGQLPDDKSHSIAYKPGLPYGYFCSEPQSIKVRNFADIEQTARGLFNAKRFSTLRTSSQELRELVRSAVSSTMRESENIIATRTRARRVGQPGEAGIPPDREAVIQDILVAREMARIDLGIDLLIAQPKD